MSAPPTPPQRPDFGRLPLPAVAGAGAFSFANSFSRGYAGGWRATTPQRADDPALQQLSGRSMGTVWQVRVRNPDMLPLALVRQGIESALARVVAQMSHWQPDSSLSRFNAAPAGHWQTLEPEFLTVMHAALHWAQRSGGAFDPSMGALVNLWGFGPRDRSLDRPDRPPPSPQDIARARQHCGWQRLQLNGAQLRQPGGLQLDLSGIAKGFAADHVSDALLALGLPDSLVEVGGEIRARGQRSHGQPWRVGVLPAADGSPTQAVTLPPADGNARADGAALCAVATSGDRWQHFSHNGQRYSHTLDARSAQPVAQAPAQVTVLHSSAMHADALATWLTVLGAQEGLPLANAQGWAACWQYGEHGPPRMSERFAACAHAL